MNVNKNDTFFDYLINNNFFTLDDLNNYYYAKELKEIKYEWFVCNANDTPIYINDVKKTITENDEFDKFINNKNNVLQYLKNNNVIKIEYTGDNNNYYKIRQHDILLHKYHTVISDLYIYRLYKELESKQKEQKTDINQLFSEHSLFFLTILALIYYYS